MMEYSLINTASYMPSVNINPSAWIGHLPFAYWVMSEIKPHVFVELGTHHGHSYFEFCQSVLDNQLPSKCYAVDLWEGDEHAVFFGEEVRKSVFTHNQKNYASFSSLMHMSFDDALTSFSDESIDLLHIDGLHTYEAVLHDFETWLPKLAPGSVILFHDTNVRERNFGVWKLWKELQVIYPNNLEFLHSSGLGVLQLNNAKEAKKIPWLQADFQHKKEFISYFLALGTRQQERYDLIQLTQEVLDKNIQNTQYINTIQELRRSNSWRITAPLRKLKFLLKHLKNSQPNYDK